MWVININKSNINYYLTNYILQFIFLVLFDLIATLFWWYRHVFKYLPWIFLENSLVSSFRVKVIRWPEFFSRQVNKFCVLFCRTIRSFCLTLGRKSFRRGQPCPTDVPLNAVTYTMSLDLKLLLIATCACARQSHFKYMTKKLRFPEIGKISCKILHEIMDYWFAIFFYATYYGIIRF